MKISLKRLFIQLRTGLAIKISFFYLIRRLTGLEVFKPYFSQMGEDIIIANLVGTKSKGFYIDVGCNDPIKYNNTFYFYLRGWSGINIDANSEMIKKFDSVRNKDINVFAAISDQISEVTYFKSSTHPEVNTIDFVAFREWKEKWNFDSESKIQTQTLSNILSNYIDGPIEIDFLSIDVEGHELQVLKSIDLEKYRPRLIMVEIHKINLEELRETSIYQYLINNNYRLVSYALINAYFMDDQSYQQKTDY